MSIAIYPGSFDPVTLGHLNIIKRASACFDKLIVCVMVNSKKHGMFTPEERVELIRRVVAKLPNHGPVSECRSRLLQRAAGRLCQASAGTCGGKGPAGGV